MSIAAVGGIPPVKLDPEATTNSKDSSTRPDNKLVNKTMGQPTGDDLRIESRIAAVKQQVGATTDTAKSNENQKVTRPKVSDSLGYALTQKAITDQDFSKDSSDGSEQESSGDSNRQSRAASTREVTSKDASIQKDPIQF